MNYAAVEAAKVSPLPPYSGETSTQHASRFATANYCRYPMDADNPFSRLVNRAIDSGRRNPERTRDASAVTRTCDQCGAPRPNSTDLRACAYCGYVFMAAPDTEVKAP